MKMWKSVGNRNERNENEKRNRRKWRIEVAKEEGECEECINEKEKLEKWKIAWKWHECRKYR